jgi:hypothetical protein
MWRVALTGSIRTGKTVVLNLRLLGARSSMPTRWRIRSHGGVL